MADGLNRGDLVKLKSGGPEMVIDSIESGADAMVAVCVWFEGTKTRKDSFGFHLLERVEKPKPGSRGSIKRGREWRSALEDES